MTTLVVNAAELGCNRLQIEAERFHHLFRVRRLKTGEPLRLTDGSGNARSATVVAVERSAATVELGGLAPANEPTLAVELVVAAPRPQRAAWLVEKATEIGARAIRFVNSERSPRRYGSSTMSRLERMAVAAVEQSERAVVPAVSGVHAWSEVQDLVAPISAAWLLDTAAASLPPAGQTNQASLAVFVGPEGGWSDSERHQLLAAGCVPVSLGARVLRVETAALAALTLAVASSVDTARERPIR